MGMGLVCMYFKFYLQLFHSPDGQETIAQDPQTHGAMFAPIILGSDKTTISVSMGDTAFYPLYISLGNVHNNIRRAHRNTVALLTFLAIPKSK